MINNVNFELLLIWYRFCIVVLNLNRFGLC